MSQKISSRVFQWFSEWFPANFQRDLWRYSPTNPLRNPQPLNNFRIDNHEKVHKENALETFFNASVQIFLMEWFSGDFKNEWLERTLIRILRRIPMKISKTYLRKFLKELFLFFKHTPIEHLGESLKNFFERILQWTPLENEKKNPQRFLNKKSQRIAEEIPYRILGEIPKGIIVSMSWEISNEFQWRSSQETLEKVLTNPDCNSKKKLKKIAEQKKTFANI